MRINESNIVAHSFFFTPFFHIVILFLHNDYLFFFFTIGRFILLFRHHSLEGG